MELCVNIVNFRPGGLWIAELTLRESVCVISNAVKVFFTDTYGTSLYCVIFDRRCSVKCASDATCVQIFVSDFALKSRAIIIKQSVLLKIKRISVIDTSIVPKESAGKKINLSSRR